MTQTIELANKDLKTVIITIFNTVRKVEEILSMLNRALEENLTDTIAVIKLSENNTLACLPRPQSS